MGNPVGRRFELNEARTAAVAEKRKLIWRMPRVVCNDIAYRSNFRIYPHERSPAYGSVNAGGVHAYEPVQRLPSLAV
jgi:hypothetical protein